MSNSNDKLPRNVLPIPDIEPVGLTTYDAKDPGLPQPTAVNGILQKPLEGVSMDYTFADAKAEERHQSSISRCLATGASTTRAGRP